MKSILFLAKVCDIMMIATFVIRADFRCLIFNEINRMEEHYSQGDFCCGRHWLSQFIETTDYAIKLQNIMIAIANEYMFRMFNRDKSKIATK